MKCIGCGKDHFYNWTTEEPCKHMVCDSCAKKPGCQVCLNLGQQMPIQNGNSPNVQMSSKVYVANLPHETTEDELRMLFSTCGQIQRTIVNPFVDFQANKRSYGFVIFKDVASAYKACGFNEKTYKNHTLMVINDSKAHYGVAVKNIPFNMPSYQLNSIFSKFGPVKSVNQKSSTTAYVYFQFEDSRKRSLGNVNGPNYLFHVEIKEPLQKMSEIIVPIGRAFPLVISPLKPSITKQQLMKMFEIFGPVKNGNVEKSSNCEYGIVHFYTQEARDEAIRIANGQIPDGWEFSCTLSDSFTPRNSPVQAPSPSPVSDRRRSVKVSGFDSTTTEDHLRALFEDIGTIVQCRFEYLSKGKRAAIITFLREESVSKALVTNYGHGLQDLTVERLGTIGTIPLNSPNANNPPTKLNRAVSEMSLNRNPAPPVPVSPISRYSQPFSLTGGPDMVNKLTREFPYINVINVKEFSECRDVASGEFGSVFYAKTQKYGEVAVKSFRSDYLTYNHQEVLNMIKHSTHANIIRFIGILVNEDHHPLRGYVMEYMGDNTVKSALHGEIEGIKAKLIGDKRRSWICQAGAALSYLHERNILHRDIKPDNMLLCDSLKTLKICDLGTSRSAAMSDATMTGGVGTPLYTAPEVLKSKPYGKPADVYSFTVCVWEIFTRRRPFDHLANSTSWYTVVSENLRPDLSEITDGAMKGIFNGGWHVDETNRMEMPKIVKFFSEKRVPFKNL